MRVAVIHDWLYVVGGAEKVLLSILKCFPGADLFTLFDILPDCDRARIGYEKSYNSFLQKMPGIRRFHRLYLPLMPLAVEQFDLSDYDLVISSSYAVAKGVLTGPDQFHVSYVHSPMRYAWDLQHQYLRASHLDKGTRSWLARSLLARMRVWDVRTSSGVDQYIANSHFVGRRIKKVYGREALVIYPPVCVPPNFQRSQKDTFIFTASRLVPYKNVRAIVEAFALLPNERLVVAGDGPERDDLRRIAPPNVHFVGFVSKEELVSFMARCAAFVFAAEEDFGIALVEAQACGTPVIALNRGGARETTISSGPSATGILFQYPDAQSIAEAVRRFMRDRERFDSTNCYRNALRFSEQRFEGEFTHFVQKRYSEFVERRNATTVVALESLPAFVG